MKTYNVVIVLNDASAIIDHVVTNGGHREVLRSVWSRLERNGNENSVLGVYVRDILSTGTAVRFTVETIKKEAGR